MKSRPTLVALALAPLTVAPLSAQDGAAPAGPAMVHTPPQGCLAYFECRAPGRTVDALVAHPVLGPLLDELGAATLADAPDLADLFAALATEDDAGPGDGLARYAGDGLALWVTIEQLQPVVTVALPSPTEEAGRARRGELFGLLERLSGAPGAVGEPTERLERGEVWSLDEELHVAGVGADTYVSNSRNALRLLLEPRRRAPGRRVLQELVDAHARRAGNGDLYAWLDVGAVRTIARFAGDSLPQDGPVAVLTALNDLPGDPRAQSLLGPGIARLGLGSSWSLRVEVELDTLAVDLASDGIAEPSVLAPRGPAPAGLAHHRTDCAHAFVYRDFGTLLARRESLFQGPELANIAMTESQLELFLGGLTLEEDVLPAVSPWIEVVARTLDFDDAPRPGLRLPAAAAIFRLTGDPAVGAHLDAAFQGLVSVTNVQRAQNGEPPLRLVLGREGERTWTAAQFLPVPRAGEPVDAIHNLMPAAGVVGDRWVLATHEELLVELMDELAAAGDRPTTTDASGAAAERLVLRGAPLAALAAEQLDALALMQSLEDGVPREQARADLEGLVWLLERTDAALRIEHAAHAVVVGARLTFPRGEGAR